MITVAAAVGYGSWLAASHWLGTSGAFFAVFMLALIASSLWSEYKNPTQPKPREARPQATPKPPRVEPYLRRPAARLTIEGGAN